MDGNHKHDILPLITTPIDCNYISWDGSHEQNIPAGTCIVVCMSWRFGFGVVFVFGFGVVFVFVFGFVVGVVFVFVCVFVFGVHHEQCTHPHIMRGGLL